MKELEEQQLAELERLREEVAAQEPGLAAAIRGYNATVRAAYEEFLGLAAEYQRARGDFEALRDDIVAAMMEHAGAAGNDRPEGGEGQAYMEWMNAWIEVAPTPTTFERPRELKAPDPPLSAAIAALPRRPTDVEKPPEAANPRADRPIDPEVSASVRAAWRRIDAWLAEHAPMLAGRMNPGATPAAIARAEASLGAELPDAVRASYLIHDGSEVGRLFPAGEYLSLAGMLGAHEIWRNSDEADREWMGDGGQPKGPIRQVHYDLKWIPLTDNGGGDGTLIDLAPAEGGVVGQLIDFGHDLGPEVVAAPGLAEYLAYLADGLDAGAATVVERGYLEWTRGEEFRRSAYAPIAPRPVAAEVAAPAPRYFEFTGGTSSKFWEVSCAGDSMTTRWGKIGTQGQAKAKSFAGPGPAAAEMARAIARKIKEGYVEQSPASPAAGPPGGARSAAGAEWSAAVDPEAMLGAVLPAASDRRRRLLAVACCRRVEGWFVGYAIAPRDDDYRRAVATAERFADGAATPAELAEACEDADDSALANHPYRDESWTAPELRKVTFGDDPGWPARLLAEIDEEDYPDLDTDPAALDAWLAAEEDAQDCLRTSLDPLRDVASRDMLRAGETIGRQILLIVRDFGGRAREAEERAAQAALIRDIFGDPFPPPAFDPGWSPPAVTALAETIYEEKAFDRMPALADALEAAGCRDPAILAHCRGPGPHVRGCWVLDRVLGKE